MNIHLVFGLVGQSSNMKPHHYATLKFFFDFLSVVFMEFVWFINSVGGLKCSLQHQPSLVCIHAVSSRIYQQQVVETSLQRLLIGLFVSLYFEGMFS